MSDDNVLIHARREFVTLRRDWTIGAALQHIRDSQVPGPILYFYVVDDDDKLVGVLPARALLVAQLDDVLGDRMIKKLVTVSHHASMHEAATYFILHRFLALPVVDDDNRVVAVIDVNAFTDEVFDIAERRNMDTVFESIGLRISEARDASALRAFRLRFPWLLATIAGGTACAVLSSFFGATLEQSIVLAFFLTLVLGLGESVAAQSMTLAVQQLRTSKPTLAWFMKAGGRELAVALLLGLACGSVVGAIVLGWHGQALAATVIGGSIAASLVSAALLGLAVPSLLRALKLDPRVAAGPVTLAFTDLATLTIYFSAATVVLAS